MTEYANSIKLKFFHNLPLGNVLTAILSMGRPPSPTHPGHQLYTKAFEVMNFYQHTPRPFGILNQNRERVLLEGFKVYMEKADATILQNIKTRTDMFGANMPMASQTEITGGGSYLNNPLLMQNVRNSLPTKQALKVKNVYMGTNPTGSYQIEASPIKYSTFTVTLNTNRSYSAGDPRSDGLKNAFRSTIKELLALMEQGHFIKRWRVLKNGTYYPNMEWNSTTVLKFQTGFALEVAPKNSYLHAHLYIGIVHKMHVLLMKQAMQNFVLTRMNSKNHAARNANPNDNNSDSQFFFGPDLIGVHLKIEFRPGAIETTFENWKKYVSKEYIENRLFWEEIQRERDASVRAEFLRQQVAQESGLEDHFEMLQNNQWVNYLWSTNKTITTIISQLEFDDLFF